MPLGSIRASAALRPWLCARRQPKWPPDAGHHRVRGVSTLIGWIPNRPEDPLCKPVSNSGRPLPNLRPTLCRVSVIGCGDVGTPPRKGWLGSVGIVSGPPSHSSHAVEHGSRVRPRCRASELRSEPTPSVLGIPAGAPWRPLAYIGGGRDGPPPPRPGSGAQGPPSCACLLLPLSRWYTYDLVRN